MKALPLFAMLVALFIQPVQAAPADDISMYAVSLVGSPYRLGGNDPDTGLDCSGLVDHVFRQISGIQLPRGSLAISASTQPLDRADLQPGDLVFFNTLRHAFSHVGIYLGEDRFVHAASSRTGTVMVSRLSDRYWHERFDGARRVALPADPSATLASFE